MERARLEKNDLVIAIMSGLKELAGNSSYTTLFLKKGFYGGKGIFLYF